MELEHEHTRAAETVEARGFFMVVDTNCFLAYLPWLSCLSKAALHSKIRLVVPWIVACELDSLKQRPRANDGNFEIGAAARAAIRFLFNAFKHDQVLGQDKDIVDSHQTRLTNDDRIMHCCLQVMKSPYCQKVLLLSDDKSLGVKGLMNGIETFTFANVPGYIRDMAMQGFKEKDSMDIDYIDGTDPVGWLPVQSWFQSNPPLKFKGGQTQLVASVVESLRNSGGRRGGKESLAACLTGLSKDSYKQPTELKFQPEGYGSCRTEEIFRRFGWLGCRMDEALPQANDELWRVLKEICHKVVPKMEKELQSQHGSAWDTVVNCPQPWEEGDVLHILRTSWRTVFQKPYGLYLDEVASLQDLLRKLRRKATLIDASVHESLDYLNILWTFVECFRLEDKKEAVLASARYILDCVRYLEPKAEWVWTGSLDKGVECPDDLTGVLSILLPGVEACQMPLRPPPPSPRPSNGFLPQPNSQTAGTSATLPDNDADHMLIE
ncbi:hypothetical protein GUITHDRAFT_142256 [Guillardia theta CCMP2712]|uniref:PIN domain-containing protein n=1 Tax=Guillardia theta (strain CCMP2712) TaxID=905079 RepID=L1IYW8_GUITC|nr:hypothetical protein GUITHDRAFT_142256 [Guillardia theta CCMP2712]EKX41099.1 hypothetical protein GUITHDRAFT_142256 [Guillardia theta CCMP2712]|eukprot:XP_005828079.1 hypothetical protein GUITHDRAFT_142256 [Guillardia theta CCMP2712]